MSFRWSTNSTASTWRKRWAMITGHCGLNKHLYTISRSRTKMCPHCKESEETVEHFLGQCPATALLRGKTFCNYYMNARDIFKKHALSTIIKFIRYTNRFSDLETWTCRGYLVLPMFRPLSIIVWPFSLQLTLGRRSPSTFSSYFLIYLSSGAGRASSSLASGVQSLFEKKLFWIIVFHLFDNKNQHCRVIK